jgi:hypothetical protein
LADALMRRTEFPLEWMTAWTLGSVSELQAQRDVLDSWAWLTGRGVDIPLVVTLSK